MRRLSKLFLVTAAALVAAVVLYTTLTLPPATKHLPPSETPIAYGAYHVHTNRSDGSGTRADVARAAAEAGLQFVIVTDHGDATRQPDAPEYLDGVLLIDGVEISTISGHLVALGLSEPSAYPLGAEARDTVEDVHRMGGWTVIAHPDSPKPGLRWRGSVGGRGGAAAAEVPVDAVEWLNADSEWRDEPPTRLIATALRYLFRAPEAIASIFDRPAPSLRRWDQMARTRPIVGLAAVDAHARIGLDESAEPRQARTLFARPSYRDMFEAVVQAVPLRAPLSGDAAEDAGVILGALRAGQTFSVISALATPGVVTLTATDGASTIGMGESLASDGPIRIVASVPAPADARVVLLRNGEEVAAHVGQVEFQHTGTVATYRTEVHLPGHDVPWIVTNALRLGPIGGEAPPRVAPVVPPLGRSRALNDSSLWVVEKHPASRADLALDGNEVSVAYALAAGRPNGQYVAIAYPLNNEESFDRVTLTLRSADEMRLSVQVRLPGDDGERWQRSVYVSPTSRTVTLRLEDFLPTNRNTSRRPIVARLQSLLLVVDTWHTKPGTSGKFWVSDVTLGAPEEAARTAPITSGR